MSVILNRAIEEIVNRLSPLHIRHFTSLVTSVAAATLISLVTSTSTYC